MSDDLKPDAAGMWRHSKTHPTRLYRWYYIESLRTQEISRAWFSSTGWEDGAWPGGDFRWLDDSPEARAEARQEKLIEGLTHGAIEQAYKISQMELVLGYGVAEVNRLTVENERLRECLLTIRRKYGEPPKNEIAEALGDEKTVPQRK